MIFGLLLLAGISLRSHAVYLVGSGWVIFGLVMITLTHEIRCPRCGERFYVKETVFWQMAAKCLHCGQKKYADVGAPMKLNRTRQ